MNRQTHNDVGAGEVTGHLGQTGVVGKSLSILLSVFLYNPCPLNMSFDHAFDMSGSGRGIDEAVGKPRKLASSLRHISGADREHEHKGRTFTFDVLSFEF